MRYGAVGSAGLALGRRSPPTVPTHDDTQFLWPDLLHFGSPRCNILPLEQAIGML